MREITANSVTTISCMSNTAERNILNALTCHIYLSSVSTQPLAHHAPCSTAMSPNRGPEIRTPVIPTHSVSRSIGEPIVMMAHENEWFLGVMARQMCRPVMRCSSSSRSKSSPCKLQHLRSGPQINLAVRHREGSGDERSVLFSRSHTTTIPSER